MRMRDGIGITMIFILGLLLIYPRPTEALGGYLTNTYTQVAPAEVKAMVSFDGTYETITATQTFNFNPLVAWNFIWLIAVPSRPEVTFLKDDSFFVSWDKLTNRRFAKDSPLKQLLYFDVSEEASLPEDTFSRPIDFIQYRSFAPGNQYADLMKWIGSFGYVMPKTSVEMVKEYGRHNWHLLAVEVNGNHIQYAASDSLTVKAAHTMPLRIRFKTDKPIFPMKLMSMQPDIDSVAVPLGYAYGSKSTEILGISDHEIDAVAATQSALKYPHLPLDLSNVKIDIYVMDRHKASIKGFTTAYANRITHNGRSVFLTRLFTYRPMSQMQDLSIVPSRRDDRVNAAPSIVEILIRAAVILAAAWIIFKLVVYETKKRRNRNQ